MHSFGISLPLVMSGLIPAIHALRAEKEDEDAHDKRAPDARRRIGKGTVTSALAFLCAGARFCPPADLPRRRGRRWAKARDALHLRRGSTSAFANPTAVLAFTLVLTSNALAQDGFRGKEINLYVGSAPGGPYDAY